MREFGLYPGWGVTEAIKRESVFKIWPFGKIIVGRTPLLIYTELNEKDKLKMLGIFKNEN